MSFQASLVYRVGELGSKLPRQEGRLVREESLKGPTFHSLSLSCSLEEPGSREPPNLSPDNGSRLGNR